MPDAGAGRPAQGPGAAAAFRRFANFRPFRIKCFYFSILKTQHWMLWRIMPDQPSSQASAHAKDRGGYVPLIGFLRRYGRGDFQRDLVAGLIVAAISVPQAVAYAFLAGLPPQAGLYACLAPMVIYAVLGSSRHLVVGPVAVAALMVAAAIGLHAPNHQDNHLGVATVICLEAGLFLLLLRVTQMGGLVHLLSHPVVTGFVNAAATATAWRVGFGRAWKTRRPWPEPHPWSSCCSPVRRVSTPAWTTTKSFSPWAPPTVTASPQTCVGSPCPLAPAASPAAMRPLPLWRGCGEGKWSWRNFPEKSC